MIGDGHGTPWLDGPKPLPRPHVCVYCGERFGTGASLASHVRRMHDEQLTMREDARLTNLVSHEARNRWKR
jgi:hypothetical protein